MKLCPYCSKEMELSAVVCTHCGRDWKTGASAAPEVILRQPSPTETPGASGIAATAENQEKAAAFWWCVAVILIVVLVGGFCALIPDIH